MSEVMVETRGGAGKKLTAEEVRAIRARANDGMTSRELAEVFNVSHVTISNILQHKFYKWVR